jgi:hypothetical protein
MEGEVYLHAFLNLVQHGGEWLASRTEELIPGRNPDDHQRGISEVPRAGLNEVAKRNILDPVGSQTPAIQLVATHYTWLANLHNGQPW